MLYRILENFGFDIRNSLPKIELDLWLYILFIYLLNSSILNRKYKDNNHLGKILEQMKKSVKNIYNDDETINRLEKCKESVKKEGGGCSIM